MSIIRKNVPRKTWAKVIALAVGVLLLSGYVIWDILAGGPLTSLLSNHDRVVAFVERMGFFAPFIYILLQIAQIILAPIPGQVVGGVGGYLFGWWGILWTLIGSTIGYLIMILISRKFGRSLIEKIFKKSAMDKFDFIFGENAAIILFLVFLLPGLPDDMVGYMAGLTDVPIKSLIVLMTLGHIPTIIITNYIGMGLGESNLVPVAIVAVVVVLIFGVALWQKDRIIKLLKKQKPTDKE
ncbi:TVP38/TMEM64 family protein [Candidatus Saccharibacteria bacterium]|nr:TVP38/TMEM64 family protein [Candidatus Saccharibacteria bacterium]